MNPTTFPLAWPDGWDRSVKRVPAKFDEGRTRFQAYAALRDELQRLGVPPAGYIVSSNASGMTDREPQDPGVALYFKRDREVPEFDHVLACDRFTRVADNVWALVKTIQGMRQQERYGVATIDRALRAYRALPAPEPPKPKRHWTAVFGLAADADLDVIEAVYKAKAKKLHPDAGGADADAMAELNMARDEARSERGG